MLNVGMTGAKAKKLQKIIMDTKGPKNRHRDGEAVYADCKCAHHRWLRKKLKAAGLL